MVVTSVVTADALARSGPYTVPQSGPYHHTA